MVPSTHSVHESDEYPELKPDLIALRDVVCTRTRLRIASCQKLTRGTYHEIYILNTADGKKLIARLFRCPRDPATLRSEVATMNHSHVYTCCSLIHGLPFLLALGLGLPVWHALQPPFTRRSAENVLHKYHNSKPQGIHMQRSPGGSDPLSSLLSILNSKEVRVISKHKVYSN